MRRVKFDYQRSCHSLVDDEISYTTRLYPVWKFMSRFVAIQARRYYIGWFYVVSLLQTMHIEGNSEWWSTVLLVSIMILLSFIRGIKTFRLKLESLKSQSKRACLVWENQSFVEAVWSKVKIGQVILVKEMDLCPAPVVIIAVGSDDNTCYVDSFEIIGESSLEFKKPLVDSQRLLKPGTINSTSLNIKRLSGSIQLDGTEDKFSIFRGRIKFRGFPKSSRLAYVNQIPRGSKLVSGSWAIGISLDSFSDYQTFMSKRLFEHPMSQFDRSLNRLTVYLLCVLIVLVIISSSVCIALSDDSYTDFRSILNVFIRFILHYKNIIPISGFFILYILRYIQKIIIQNSFIDKLIINNEEVLEDLGKVDYLLLDKTGALTEAKNVLKMCILRSGIYNNDEFTRQSTVEICHSEEDSELDSLTPKPFYKQKFGSSIFPFGYDNLTFSHLRTESEEYEYIDQFIKCMLFCVMTTPINQNDFIITKSDDKAVASSTNKLGYKILNRGLNFIHLEEHGIMNKYDLLIYHHSDEANLKTRVVIRKGNSIYLYIKTDKLFIHNYITNQDDLEIIGEHFNIINSTGFKSQSFWFKQFHTAEAKVFTNKLKQAIRNQLNSDYRIELLFTEYEKDLTYLGSIGIEENILPDNRDSIDALLQIGVKPWLLSGDDEKSTLSSALISQLLSSNSQIISLQDFTSPESCARVMYKQIRRNLFHDRHNRIQEYLPPSLIEHRLLGRKRTYKSLESLEHNLLRNYYVYSFRESFIQEMNKDALVPIATSDKKIEYELNKPIDFDQINYAIVIDHYSLETALKDEDCKKMLVILLYCAKAVCFYKMLPESKGNVAKLLKTCFKFNPTVMAVGDNSSDLMMLSEADIKVAISNSNSGLLERVSDIEVKSISQIKDLLMYSGSGIYSANSRVILLYFYINFTITLISFSYTFYSDYSGTPVFDETMIILINLLFCVFPILFIGFYERSYGYRDYNVKSQLLARLRSRKSLGLKTIIECILHSMVVALIIMLFISQALTSVLNSSGSTENIELFQISCLLSLVLCILSKISFSITTYRKEFYISLFASILTLVIYLAICFLCYIPSNSSQFSFYKAGYELSSSPVLLLSILLCPLTYMLFLLILDTFSKLFNSRFIYKALYSKFNLYKDDISKIYKSTINARSHHDIHSFMISPFSLHFGSPTVESQYRKKYIQEDIYIIRYAALMFLCLHVGWVLIQLYNYNTEKGIFILMTLFSVVYPILIIVSYTKLIYKIYIPFIIIGVGLLLILKTVMEVKYPESGYLSSICVPTVTHIFLNIEFIPICALNLENIVLIIVSLYMGLGKTYESVEMAMLMMLFMLYIIAVTVVSMLIGYNIGKSRRHNFQLMEMIALEMQKSQNILSFLLPSFVKKRVKDGVRYIAEDQGVVSVMFCDICDFDKICSMYSPQELTDFLDELFQKFDILCEEYGVAKIETVGKTYMACAGLKDSENEIQSNISDISHANRTIELAFRLLNTTENIKLSNGDNLQVKIGINSGPVIAGVVGYHKPQFSLIGDTINTASRMCSTIEVPNKIQISIETFDCLDDSNNIEFHSNSITAKGKGVLNTYLVSEKIKEYNPFINEKPIIDIREADINLENFPKSAFESTKLSIPNSSRSNYSNSPKPRLSSEISQKDIQILSNLEEQLDIDPAQVYDLSINTNAIEGVTFTSMSRETPREREFRLNYIESIKKPLRRSIFISAVTFSLIYLVNILMYLFTPKMMSWQILLLKPIMICSQLGVLIFFDRIYKYKMFGWFMILNYVIGSLISMLFILLDLEIPNQFVALEFMYFILMINSSGGFFRQTIWGVITICVVWIAIIGYADDIVMHGLSSIFLIAYAATNAIAVYNKEKLIRYYSNLKALAQNEIHKTDDLLTQMLPPHVLKSLKQDDHITEKLNDVTLLYADIVGFTEWSSNKTPSMVVSMLSNLFTRFDKLSVIHEVYKVYTIGDCYIVMGYTGKDDVTPAQQCLNVVTFAENMLEVIDDINKESESNLEIRIGIHTGEVITGIIGTKIVRYDIYGPDVLIANKMESGGRPGAINVSDVTMNLIKSVHPYRYEFKFNTDIVAESVKRTHKSYYIE